MNDASSKANAIALLDGAMGSRMIDFGMPSGACPEEWGVQNPAALTEIFRETMIAGSKWILTCTFGGNRVKLQEYGLASRVASLNKEMARIARDAAFRGVKVGGDIGPTGQMLQPAGELSFDEAVEVFSEQAAALAEGGVDYLAIETMIDLQEARAAIIGCRQATTLPIHASMSFQNGRTLMGDSPAACAVVLQALGAEAVGCNCGAPPEELLPVVEAMAACLSVPIIAKPNAGKPVLRGGKTRYDMTPDDFAAAMLPLAAAGARRLGGCCGTSSGHIAALKQQLESMRFMPRDTEPEALLASSRQVLPFSDTLMIGNIRIDSQIGFDEAIQAGDYDAVCDIAEGMEDVQIYCLCAVGEDIDEAQALPGMARALAAAVPQPLAFRPASPQALEAALRVYPGRPLVILDCVEPYSRPLMLSIAKKYGAVTVL